MSQPFTRRQFLGNAGRTLGGLTILASARSARAYQANERLRLAVFGNMYNAQHFLIAAHICNAELVAVCNPDQRKLAETVKLWEGEAEKLAAAPRAEERQAAEHYRSLATGERGKR